MSIQKEVLVKCVFLEQILRKGNRCIGKIDLTKCQKCFKTGSGAKIFENEGCLKLFYKDQQNGNFGKISIYILDRYRRVCVDTKPGSLQTRKRELDIKIP